MSKIKPLIRGKLPAVYSKRPLAHIFHRRTDKAGNPWDRRHLAGSVSSRCPSPIESNSTKMQAGSLRSQEIQFAVRNAG